MSISFGEHPSQKHHVSQPSNKKLSWQLRAHSGGNKTAFQDLPPELLCKILSLVPFPSICCARLTCTLWNKITKDPKFVHTHFENALKKPGYLVSLSYSRGKTLLYHGHGGNVEGQLDAIELDISCPKGGDASIFYPSGTYSSGGLVAHFLLDPYIEKSSVYVCQLITGELMRVPLRIEGQVFCSLGFGFSPSTKEYKVVKICFKGNDLLFAAVYTLGCSESWREIYDVPFIPWQHNFADCDGDIFWQMDNRKAQARAGTIASFDILSENFRVWQGPPVKRFNSGNLCGNMIQIELSVAWLDGVEPNCIEVWILKNKIEEEWIRKYHIVSGVPSVVQGGNFEIIGPWIDEDLLGVIMPGRHHYTWSAKSGEFKHLPVVFGRSVDSRSIAARSHVGTLMPLLVLVSMGRQSKNLLIS